MPTFLSTLPRIAVLGLLLLIGVSTLPLHAQSTELSAVSLSLDEAVQIALNQHYSLRNTQLDIDDVNAQIEEQKGGLYPNVSFSASYTRNVVTANPFAGSSAGNIFSTLGSVQWLDFNEKARTDDDPNTVPITLDEFFRRQRDGLDAAGIMLDTNANPFGVDNQFNTGLTIDQTLYNGALFGAIDNLERVKTVNELSVDREMQRVINEVETVFYQALLAQEQVRVSRNSVARTQATLEDTKRRLAQGLTSKFERLTAEVQLANLETALLQTENQAALALNNLKFSLALPVEQPMTLRGTLHTEDLARYVDLTLQEAVQIAFEQRPDLTQALENIEIQRTLKNITQAELRPRVSAFANLNYTGSVPDNRTSAIADENDPFTFTEQSLGFFSGSYWNPSVAVGLRVSWTIFNGFSTSARMQRNEVSVQRAMLQHEQLQQAVQLEVEQALRTLRSAAQRIVNQAQNVERAELNYEYARTRLAEGVSSNLDERQASDLLDQSRLGYLQAVFDYLVARSNFQLATGSIIQPNGPSIP